MSTHNILAHAIKVTDWLISVGASQDLAEDLLRDLFDVYAINLDDYYASQSCYS